MPYINVKTNSERINDAQETVKSELGNAITAIRGKSEAWLMVNIDKPSAMYFKGDSAPCAMFEVSVFGSASGGEYEDLTKRICKISEELLGVSPDRTYVKYYETNRWGWNNMNF